MLFSGLTFNSEDLESALASGKMLPVVPAHFNF